MPITKWWLMQKSVVIIILDSCTFNIVNQNIAFLKLPFSVVYLQNQIMTVPSTHMLQNCGAIRYSTRKCYLKNTTRRSEASRIYDRTWVRIICCQQSYPGAYYIVTGRLLLSHTSKDWSRLNYIKECLQVFNGIEYFCAHTSRVTCMML